MVAHADALDDAPVVVGAQKARDGDGVGAVGEVEGQHRAAVFGAAAGDGDDVALDGDLAGFERQGVHGRRLLADGAAEEQVPLGAVPPAVDGRSGGGRRRGLGPGIIRHDGRGFQAVVGAQALGERVDVHGRGHGGKTGADHEGPLPRVYLRIGHVCLFQSARKAPQILTAGKNL